MTTTNKDFRVKNGLIVEGNSATVNGNQVITSADATNYALLNAANTFTNSPQTITAASTTTIGLIINAVSAQTANIIQWQNNSGSTGGVLYNGSISIPRTSGYYFNTGSAGGNERASILSNSSNELTLNTASGLVATFSSLGTTATLLSNLTTTPAAVVLTVKGTTSQSANLQEWQNSGGTSLAWFTSNGTLNVRYARATTNDSTVIPLIAKGATSQTASLQEWQNSSGTVVASVNSSGGFRNTVDSVFGATFVPYVSIGAGYAYTAGMNLYVLTTNASTIGQVIRGRASQTANLQEWQNSAGTAVAKIDAYGTFQNGTAGGYGAWINVQPAQASDKGIIVRGATSQTADLQQWQDSSGTILSAVDKAGNLTKGDGDQLVLAGQIFG